MLQALVIALLALPTPAPMPPPPAPPSVSPPATMPSGAPQPTVPSGSPQATVPSGSPQANAASGDGGVAMSVVSVDCDHPTATGTACYVTVRAVNISDGFPVFTESDQVAYDTAGHAYRPDATAGLAANHGKPITQRLDRGVPVSGVLVFDLPAGAALDHLVLHGKTGTPGEIFLV